MLKCYIRVAEDKERFEALKKAGILSGRKNSPLSVMLGLAFISHKYTKCL
jgi:hypothetical protein